MSYYHVRITPKDDPQQDRVKLDLTRAELEERFVEPYKNGQPIVINGRTIEMDNLKSISISMSEQDSTYLAPIVELESHLASVRGSVAPGVPKSWFIADKGKDVTDSIITEPPGSNREKRILESRESQPATDAREVFVVHGRNHAARDALFAFLRSIGLDPLEWTVAVQATDKPSPYIGEILNAAFARAHAVVVLFTPDDEARLKEQFRAASDPPHETQLTGQARANVLFEAGMAMGRSEDRTVLVELGTLRPFSDVAGRHTIRLDGTSQRRHEFAQRLETAGCPVNLKGIDWHTAGDFESALQELIQSSSNPTSIADPEVSVAATLGFSDEAIVLLKEAAKDSDGAISTVRTFGGMRIQTHGKEFGESGNARLEAMWKSALSELVDSGCVNDETGKGQVFRVTREGFEAADSINSK